MGNAFPFRFAVFPVSPSGFPGGKTVRKENFFRSSSLAPEIFSPRGVHAAAAGFRKGEIPFTISHWMNLDASRGVARGFHRDSPKSITFLFPK